MRTTIHTIGHLANGLIVVLIAVVFLLPEAVSAIPTCYTSQGYYYTRTYQAAAYQLVTHYRSCGWLWRSRCVSGYSRQTYYRTAYRSDLAYRSVARCCPQFTGTHPNCRPVCSPSCGNGHCTYSNGANFCRCNTGWSGTRCYTDVNECLSSSTCHSLATCHNTPGSYRCACITGYTFAYDGYTCVDVNECTSGSHTCQDDIYCHNTVGSYNCSCAEGYRKDDSNPRDCNDINECLIGNGGCQQTCVNTNGSYHCACTLGNYRLNADNKSCSDINECTEGTHSCSRTERNSFCVNTIGSYRCQCITGYQNSQGVCIDINECSSNNGGCSQVCNNTQGSYFCTCESGYSLNGRFLCEDDNECNGDHGCHQLCVNTPGSYRCDCSLGYTLADDKVNCILQECSPKLIAPLHGNLSCPDGQVTNTSCNTSCNPGYKLSGPSERTCLPNGSWTSPSVTCQPMRCSQLDQIQNGYARLPCPGHYGSNCSLQCIHGFEVRNGNSSFSCDLTDDQSTVQWSHYGTCERKPLCDSTTCVHGKCVEISQTEFQCNCTGTLYTGKRCHRSLILVPEIGELRIGTNFDLQITAAVPNDTLTIKFPCGSGGGIFPITGCDVTFTKNRDSTTVSASAGFVAAIPGVYNLPFQLDGPSADDYDVPKPLTVFVNNGRNSFYYTKLESPLVYSSCCQVPSSTPLLKCGMNPRLGIKFKSSCSWSKEEGSVTWKTNGIVFSDYNNLQLPVSVAGLKMTKRPSSLNIEVPASSRISVCGNCDGTLTDLRSLSDDNMCYSYKPEPEDLREFVSRQSLTETFITEVNSKLLPTWINMTVSDHKDAVKRQAEADYRVSIASETQLLQLPGCESVILDSKGHFSVLLHNGPLDIKLQTPSLERLLLPIPNRGSFYCLAVELCFGSFSPVYIGIPSTAQDDFTRISFLSEYIRKGWQFKFLSFIFWSHSTMESTGYQYWNGLTHDYTPLVLAANVKANIRSRGNFTYQQTSVMFAFNGNLSYKYVNRRNKVNNIITFGEHTLSISTPIYGNKEYLSLQNSSSVGYIYYNGAADFSCSSSSLIPNGIALKLSYRVETTQGFFFSLFQLPYDTRHCPVDMFINIDSSKSMNGLSFYSSCLELVYDRLVMSMLSHKFYIPMDSNTLCVDFQEFTNHFSSSSSSYGLLVQSSLFPGDLSYYQLNGILKVLPGRDNITMTMAFSKMKNEKFGLIHSVEIAVLDGNFVSQIMLQNSQMSFSGSAVIFGSDMYFAHMKGIGSTIVSWMKAVFALHGWFPREESKFLLKLEKSVQQHLTIISNRANSRLATASDEVTTASDGFSTAQATFNEARSQFFKMDKEYQDKIKEKDMIRTRLEAAENELKNATDDLEEAKAAIEDLCKIQTCSQVCMETTKTRVVVENIYKDETYRCNSLCPKTVTIALRRYKQIRRWRWRYTCYPYFPRCGWFLCVGGYCGSRCVPYYYWQLYYVYQRVTVDSPCQKDCTRRVFVRSTRKTIMETVPCGQMVPEAMCARNNQLCQVQRTSAFTLIDERRKDLTKPLRVRNTAKRDLAIAENKLLKASVARDRAQEKADAARVAFDRAEQRRNATIELRQQIRESDDTGYQISELLKTNPQISNAFRISNITFSVSHGTTTVPHSFPINIMYTTDNSDRVFETRYNFKTAFLAQKDSLIDSIVSDMLNKRSSREILREKRNSHEETERDGETEFQVRCVQLNSLANFLYNLNKTLTTSNRTRTKMEKEIQASLNRFHSINSSLTSSNFSANYSSLKESFNISFQDFEEVKNRTESSDEDELSTFVEVLEELIFNARESLASVESDSISDWKKDRETSFESNYTLGNSLCFGFKDCILIFNSELENVLDFAPDVISNTIRSLIPMAMSNLLLLSSNTSDTFNSTFHHIQPMMNVISVMNKTGYWCAQPPTIVTNPPNVVNTSVGSTLVLKCLGKSFLSLTYQWRKDGVIINGAKNSTFTLANMRVFDEGNYTCDITNAVSTINTTNASVLTFQLPRFYLTPVSIITYIGSGNGALFTCNATSRPDPGWKWFHRKTISDEWKEIEGEETNELFISKPIKKDIGWYYCMAVNYHGNISSHPVYLRLVTVTARVNSLPVRFIMERIHTNDISKRQVSDLESALLRYLRERASITHHFVKNLTVMSSDNGRTYEVSFYLLSRNVTVNDTGMEPLDRVANRLRIAVEKLTNDKDRLKMLIDNNRTVATGSGTVYSPIRSSFTVQFTNILCPKGQELHSNTFLCIDCLEGQYQSSVEIVRDIEGQIIRELTPVCTPCPEDTYQDQVGGEECIRCPDNHVTLITGAKSKEDCIALCSPNTYSTTGFEPCQPCLKGYYQSEYGEMSCVPCKSENDNIACAIDPCVQEKVIGDCGGSQLRVYYDSHRRQCLPFQYGGCNGNRNNFANFADCASSCGCPNNGTLRQCQVNPCSTNRCTNFPHAHCLIDYCDQCKARFYENGEEVTDICACPSTQSLIRCPTNCTSTCQNPNPSNCVKPVDCKPSCGCPMGTVFDTIDGHCITPNQCDTCNLPVSRGPCLGSYPRWTFNVTTDQCELFSYGGCEGNSNRFASLEACHDKCGCSKNGSATECPINPCRSSNCPAYPNSVCEVDKCDDQCSARHFTLFKEVTNECDVCTLSLVVGGCNNNVTRWFFNKDTKRCEQFIYSGCDGNANNFEHLEQCLSSCVSCQPGVSKVYCNPNPCDSVDCSDQPDAICVANNCGLCTFNFYNTSGHDVTEQCINCPPGKPKVVCINDPCQYQSCQNYPEAMCTVNVCGQCSAQYIVNETDVTEYCGATCPIEGQVYKPCVSSCQETCNSILGQKPVICSPHCKPGCDCPAGQVLNEELNKCVYREACACPECEPVPDNCTDVITLENITCSCPFCGDCQIDGQTYQESGSCPKTCTDPNFVCQKDVPGCSCPDGQLIDEEKNSCVDPKDCPTPDTCQLPPFRGPCRRQIKRYFYNSTSSRCEAFYYGGCYANRNNFQTLHECENQCSACPPTCTSQFCTSQRGAVCTIPMATNATSCPGNCSLSSCFACYYSYTTLMLPSSAQSCPVDCPVERETGRPDEKCVMNWGYCVLLAYTNIYREILTHEKTSDAFKCWSYPCQ